jgi:hypothetical protein
MLTTIMRYSDPFVRLRQSSYRRGLHLNELEKTIVARQGFIEIADHCRDTINRIEDPRHCHRDTPMRGVVPKALHATGTCCRKCMFSWHRIPRHRALTDDERVYVERMILRWIRKEVQKKEVFIYN